MEKSWLQLYEMKQMTSNVIVLTLMFLMPYSKISYENEKMMQKVRKVLIYVTANKYILNLYYTAFKKCFMNIIILHYILQ